MKFLIMFVILILSGSLWGCQARVPKAEGDVTSIHKSPVDPDRDSRASEASRRVSNDTDLANVPGMSKSRSPQAQGPTEYRVRLRTSDEKYHVVAEGGGGAGLNVNRSRSQEWGTFTLIDKNGGVLVSGDQVQLRTWNGQYYVVAEGGGGAGLNADRRFPKEWGTFTLIDNDGGTVNDGDLVQLRTWSGKHYVVADGGGGAGLNANRSDPQHWKSFKLNFLK